jgi:hypothetical protein
MHSFPGHQASVPRIAAAADADAAAVQSLKPEIMFRVQPAYYELGPKVAAAINQAINVGQSECIWNLSAMFKTWNPCLCCV